MSDPTRLYWDSSCFLSALKGEEGRASICEDILRHGELGNVLIFTSLWTVVEVIRPKRPAQEPLPPWAQNALRSVEKDHPEAQREMEALWRRYQSDTKLPKLTPQEISKIEGMFYGWKFVKLVRIDKAIAIKAVELQRDRNLKAGDAIHVASALESKASELQVWDRDFSRVGDLIRVVQPSFLTPLEPLLELTNESRQTFESDSVNDGRDIGRVITSAAAESETARSGETPVSEGFTEALKKEGDKIVIASEEKADPGSTPKSA